RPRQNVMPSYKITQNWSGSASVKPHYIDFVALPQKPSSKQNLPAIRRPPRVIPKCRDPPLQSRTAQGRRQIQPSVALLGSIDNIFSVRRPVRLPVVAEPLGDLNGFSAVHLFHPNVEFAATVRTKCNETAVGRPCGADLQTFVKSDARERSLGRCRRSLAPLEDPIAYRHQQHNHAKQRYSQPSSRSRRRFRPTG